MQIFRLATYYKVTLLQRVFGCYLAGGYCYWVYCQVLCYEFVRITMISTQSRSFGRAVFISAHRLANRMRRIWLGLEISKQLDGFYKG